MNFASTHGSYRASVGREMGIDPVLPREFRDLRIRAADHVKFARKRDQHLAPVPGQLEVGEAAQALPFALPPATLLRRQFFFGALQQLFRSQNFAKLCVRDDEFVKAQNGVARAASQKDHGLAVGRDLG
jgi:hypothetical protein